MNIGVKIVLFAALLKAFWWLARWNRMRSHAPERLNRGLRHYMQQSLGATPGSGADCL
jgi:hypothetical protein